MMKILVSTLLALTTLSVSAQTAPGMNSMPNLTGMALNQARQALGPLNAGLRVAENPSCSPQQDGKIMHTNPPAGVPLRPGMPIEVIVCGFPSKAVPDVMGMTRERAFQVLDTAGFGHSEEYGPGAQPGMPGLKVARQAPPANAPQKKGDKVHLLLVR